MDLFTCGHCGQRLHFENTRCESCGHRLGYLPGPGRLAALEPGDGASWRAIPPAAPSPPAPPPAAPVPPALWRFCDNAALDVCNWMLPAADPQRLCAACRHNRVIPDLARPDNRQRWHRIEDAKHRLFHTLLRLHLPLADRTQDPRCGLAFDFMEDLPGWTRVMTGQDHGVITLDITEADDALREERRRRMGEPYRTLLGHFRHESGHYFWDHLVRDQPARLAECRTLFGDDRTDYEAALRRHYAQGPPADWQDRTISAYATAHPWEDFAETWAHYLHIIDTLETARAFGLDPPARHAAIDSRAAAIEPIIQAWLPLVFAMNSLSHSMGHPDLYPFVLSPPVVRKLGFIHDLVRPFAAA